RVWLIWGLPRLRQAGGGPEFCTRLKEALLEKQERASVRTAELRRTGEDRVEDRSEVVDGGRDDAKDLACSCPPFQRLFHLREHPHVLDGDPRLVGEGPEQGDLRGREGSSPCPRQRDHADDLVAPQHGHPDRRARPAFPRGFAKDGPRQLV